MRLADSLLDLPHPEAVKFVEFSPDGSLVVTASVDGTARLERGERALLSTLPHRDAVVVAHFSPDGGRWSRRPWTGQRGSGSAHRTARDRWAASPGPRDFRAV